VTAPRPDILFIVLDAARAENFSLYGYERRTTPHLERLAESLAWYENCTSAATWTLPSTASLFTGTYNSHHRLVMDGDRLAEDYASLPEILQSAGYSTSKVTSVVPYVSDFSGLDRGFAFNWEPPPPRWRTLLKRVRGSAPPQAQADCSSMERIDHDLSVEAEAQLHARSSLRGKLSFYASGFYDDGGAACFRRVRELWREPHDAPRFVYMHLQETHGEYRPPHRYRKRFVPRELHKKSFAAINQRPNPHAVGLVDMTEEDFEVLRGLYDGAIAYMDEQLGALLDDLASQPGWDDTLVIITADHGDCVGRHGVLGHQFVCYEELLRIPWIVKWPRSVGILGAQSQLIQNVDLLPTLCGLLGLERPAQVESIDYLREQREFAYAELLKPFGVTAVKQGLHELAPHYNRAVLAVRSQRYKWHTFSNHQRDELYDLHSDPLEEQNLMGYGSKFQLDAEARSLEAAMEAWKPRWKSAADDIEARVFSGESAAVSSDVEAKLRALGYLD
jgi:arylsulfatase A-like enzyme